MSSSSCLLLSSSVPRIKKEAFANIRTKKDASTSASVSISISCKLKPAPPCPLTLFFNSNPAKQKIVLVRSRTETGSGTNSDTDLAALAGEDSAAFDLKNQKLTSWVYFSVILGVVLFLLQLLWIDNSTGYGKAFIDSVSSLSDSHEVVMLVLILIFATVHSGLASLRDMGEKVIGARAYRVLFAGVSLPLAVSTIVYFINHRYDGMQLWQLQGAPGVHQIVWLSSFVSFFFLYPSTFNLLEVAAVDEPKMHLWETGVMRITRHPQMVGQVIWCLAHTLWIGNSVAAAASLGLIGHHLFGVWNGDKRLATRYGEAFEAVKRRTSVIPFAAIITGRQILPKDYYKEFIRLPYLTITALTLGAYIAHPLMQSASFLLHWSGNLSTELSNVPGIIVKFISDSSQKLLTGFSNPCCARIQE